MAALKVSVPASAPIVLLSAPFGPGSSVIGPLQFVVPVTFSIAPLPVRPAPGKHDRFTGMVKPAPLVPRICGSTTSLLSTVPWPEPEAPKAPPLVRITRAWLVIVVRPV